MKYIVIFTIISILTGLGSCKSTRGYVSHDDYSSSYTPPISPSGYTKNEIKAHVQDYYAYWAAAYLKQADTNTSWYYVQGEANGDTPTYWNGEAAKATSEGHGYGMIITALMDKQSFFDGLFNMYKAFPSTGDPRLMSWIIPESEDTSHRSDSASDGDIDIAYALLLADSKWGSKGTINYKNEAVSIINAIMDTEISHTSWRVLLGDWDRDSYSTRPSDWIPDHFRAFKNVTGDVRWDNVINELYSLQIEIFNGYASNTGLLPDFVVGKDPKPADPDFLESEFDGCYYYNACRVPWRITCDYVLYGASGTGKQAKVTVQTMEDWIQTKTRKIPGNIKAGYTLKGKAIADYGEGCFTAPFVAGAVVDTVYQDFLDSGWDAIKTGQSNANYFNDTLTLLVMLLISGIWLAP